MSIPVTKLGWLAGVIDLKGKVIRKNNKQRATPQLVLTVESQDFTVIRELCALTGTSVEMTPARKMAEWMKRGCSEHCPEQHIHVSGPYAEGRMPPIARWTMTGASMAIVLHNILPFTITDRGWYEILAEVIRYTPRSGQGFGAVSKSIRRLVDLGWDLPIDFKGLVEDEPEPTEDNKPNTEVLPV